jgi:MFS family permease
VDEKRKPHLFYGYVVVVAAAFIMLAAWGANRSFGIFLDPILNEFGWTRASISGVFTLVLIIMGIASIAAGRLSDRFGPRPLLLVCCLFLGLGHLMVSQAKSIGQFYIFYGLITGIGMSGLYAPLMSVVVRWFVKRRVLMSSMLTASAAVGVMFFPLISSLLISSYGWRISYLILGGIVLVITVCGALFLRRSPDEMGLLPYGYSESTEMDINLQTEGFSLGESFRTRQFWLLTAVSFIDKFLINVTVVHIVIHAVGLGIPPTPAASILSIAAGVSIPARILVGAVADWIGHKRGLMICLVISMAAFLLAMVARGLWSLYLFALLFGSGLWAASAVISGMAAELFGLKSHGAIYSSMWLVGCIGGAVGPVLAGHIFDVTGSYQLAFLISALVNIGGIIALLFLHPIANR